MDLCIADETKCFSDQYRDFSYSQLESVLAMTDVSKNDFITYWSQTVAAEFGLDADEIASTYTSPSKTDSDLRAMWKYAAGKGVHATPTAFVNGAYLDNVPFTVAGWMVLLNEVYNKQYKPSSEASLFLK